MPVARTGLDLAVDQSCGFTVRHPDELHRYTADGAVEMLTDWFDPTEQDEEFAAEIRRQDQNCDAVLLGRQTFEDFRSYWPEQTDDTTGVTDQLNRVTKFVVSQTMSDP